MSAVHHLPALLTEAEAAEYLGISAITLRRMRTRRLIAFIKIGKAPKYTELHLQQFLESNTCQPANDSDSATTGSSSAKAPRPGTAPGETGAAVSSALRLAQEILSKQK